MKYLEYGRLALFFLTVGFVVVAIFFYCFIMDPEQSAVADVACTDDCDGQVATTAIGNINVHAYHQATFRLSFAILWSSHELIRLVKIRPATVPKFRSVRGIFLSLLTINAP
ncbi:MAG: hypothetical protein ABIS36_05295 [Chryseolinea sp.]